MRRISIAPKFQQYEVVTHGAHNAFRVRVKSLSEALALLKWNTPEEAAMNGLRDVIHEALVELAQPGFDREDFEERKHNRHTPWWGIELTAQVPGLEIHVMLGLKAEPSIHVVVKTAGVEVLRNAAEALQRQAAKLYEELQAIEEG